MEAATTFPPSRARAPWRAALPLRAWQQQAVAQVLERPSGAFLASATPAAGKTTFGLRVAHDLLARGVVRRVCVVAPTVHICRQWAAAAAASGIDIEPARANAEGPEPADADGVAVTYGSVAADPALHGRRARARGTLLIADEPHHMGELAAWGIAAERAFAAARLRLLLSGTPFRSDNTAIPWVTYDEQGISSADFSYSYTDALVDGVCRPITFLAYGGEMEWASGGRRRCFDFETALPRAESARRLRTALDPAGDWIGEVLRDADARLSEVRAGHPLAGGLVVAADKEHAAALAARLAAITGSRPATVTSDDPGASAAIDRFAAGDERWLVSVLMVSEGVDVPRLRVGVYATAARTELFFRQVVGRFVRRTPWPRRQMSYLLLPADPELKVLAARVEEERRHALELRPALEERDGLLSERSADSDGFVALSSSARLDDVIRSTTSEGDALHLFADVSSPDYSTQHTPAAPDVVEPDAPEPTHVRRRRLRERRSNLVREVARKRRQSHREVNARTNRSVGLRSVADATVEQLERSVARLERELRR